MYKFLKIIYILVADILCYVNSKAERMFMFGIKQIDHHQYNKRRKRTKTNKYIMAKRSRSARKREAEQEQQQGRKSIVLTEEDLQAANYLFDSLDEDGSGYLDVSEIGTFLRRIGLNPTEQDVNDMVSKVDVGQQDGKMDKKEFMKLMSSADKYGTQEEQYEEMKKAFQKFDTEGNGFLTVEQLTNVLTSVGQEMFTQEEAEHMLELVEAEGGQIDYDDLATTMTEDWGY